MHVKTVILFAFAGWFIISFLFALLAASFMRSSRGTSKYDAELQPEAQERPAVAPPLGSLVARRRLSRSL